MNYDNMSRIAIADLITKRFQKFPTHRIRDFIKKKYGVALFAEMSDDQLKDFLKCTEGDELP